MSVYLSRSDRAPDSAFEPGELGHLVAGNRGRLLDPRRTPITVVGVFPDVGSFRVRIDDFEDEGATWDVPFEKVGHYQFARDAGRAPADHVARFREVITRFDRPLSIACDERSRRETERELAARGEAARRWLASESTYVRANAGFPDVDSREGDARLYRDLHAYMDERGLAEMEDAFARQFVSNPDSGELVKGHRIVIAELGLVPFAGTIVRDPKLFDDAWSRERRTEHVLARLAFMRAVFAHLERTRLVLYRGLSTEGPLETPANATFVSASFSEAVARSHYESGGEHATRLLMRQSVPVSRVFMTYLETAGLNDQFKEAEAVLLYDGENRAF